MSLINHNLISLIQRSTHIDLTIQQLTDEYLALHGLGVHPSRSKLRQWIYGRLMYLVRHALLTKHQDQDPVVYRITPEFEDKFGDDTQPESVTSSLSKGCDSLEQRLNSLKIEMQASAAECEEYQRLSEEFPEQIVPIKRMHQEAKDRSSELMGQVRALNNVLQLQAHPLS